MKKISMLLLAIGCLSVAQAQYRSYPDDRNHDREVILGQQNDRGYENASRYTFSFSERERDKQIDRINKDFDKRMRRVEKERRMDPYEKSHIIRDLEDQRRNEIRRVWERYHSPYNAANNNRYRQHDRHW